MDNIQQKSGDKLPNSTSLTAVESGDASGNQSAPQRYRGGRPRKVHSDESATVAVSETPAQPRGRPRKELAQPGNSSTAKRPPGRPPSLDGGPSPNTSSG